MGETGGGSPGPNPAGEPAKTILGPVLCAPGLLMVFVGAIDEDGLSRGGSGSASRPWRSRRSC